MKITEIAAASALTPLKLSPQQIQTAEVDGDFEGKDVLLLSDSTYNYYFFADEQQLLAYVAINKTLENDRYPLVRYENAAKIPGLVTSLVIYLTAIKDYKLVIKNTEELTKDGITWLISLINSGGRGLKITDSNRDPVYSNVLWSEWEYSLHHDFIAGPTSIFIENKNINKQRLIEHNSTFKNHELLMPVYRYQGDTNNI
jgi:hypothetical protein